MSFYFRGTGKMLLHKEDSNLETEKLIFKLREKFQYLQRDDFKNISLISTYTNENFKQNWISVNTQKIMNF